MSTEYTAQPSSGMASTGTSIVEVEPDDASLFKLQRPPSSEDEDKLMMTEYDEDNVIVIDLSEERNASARNLPDLPDEEKPQGPRQMFGSGNSLNGGTITSFPVSSMTHQVLPSNKLSIQDHSEASVGEILDPNQTNGDEVDHCGLSDILDESAVSSFHENHHGKDLQMIEDD